VICEREVLCKVPDDIESLRLLGLPLGQIEVPFKGIPTRFSLHLVPSDFSDDKNTHKDIFWPTTARLPYRSNEMVVRGKASSLALAAQRQ
jgi:hypothetical protein